MIKKYVEQLERKSNKEREIYIKEMLTQIEIPFKTQKVRGLSTRGENIIIDYPFGKNIPQAKKKVLLGAHHNKVMSPGANDNGSGVSVLLAFLERLQQEKPISVCIRAVFFALEDNDPFLLAGSRKYVREYGVEDLDRVYNIDTVGRGERLVLIPVTPQMSTESWIQPIIVAAKKYDLPAILKLKSGQVFVTDHMPFRWKGLKRVCTFMVFPQKDLEHYKYPYDIFAQWRYRFFKSSNVPLSVKHYHNKDDTSEFVEEETLQKVFDILWEVVVINT